MLGAVLYGPREHVHLHGGPAPVRRYLPELIKLVWNRKINPGKVLDLTLPLDHVAEGYRAMDERRPIKTLLRPRGALRFHDEHMADRGTAQDCQDR
jgi:Zn-dependent alcohol dehydrogenase